MKALTYIIFVFSFVICNLWGITNKDNKINYNIVDRVNTLNEKALLQISQNNELAFKTVSEALKLAKDIENDSLILNSLLILGKYYTNVKSYRNAKNIYLEILDLAINKKKIFLESIFMLGQISFDLADYNNALRYYEKSLKMSAELNDKLWQAVSLDAIGATYYASGNYDEALIKLNESLDVYRSMKQYKNIVRLLYGKGAAYTALSKYDRAIDLLLESLQMSQDMEYKEYEALSTHAIAMIYERLKNYQTALDYNKISLSIANISKIDYIIGDVLLHIGKIHFHISSYDSALIYANKSLKVQEKIYDKVGIANVFDLLGEIYLEIDQLETALRYYSQSRKLLENVKQKYRHTKITNHLGVVYTKMGKYDLAREHLHKSLEAAKNIGAQDLVKESLSALSDYYARIRNYQKAYHYQAEFTHLNDSIFTTSSHHIAEMQMRYETGKREKENELLKSKIEIQNLEIEKSNLQNWLSYLSLVIVSIIGFFSYNRFKAKKKATIVLERKVQDALKKHQEQQEIIFHQANLSSLGELAAGLAHEINQPLQAIKLSAESLDLDIRELKIDSSVMRENISEIYQSVDRAKSIIDHVRIFASQQKNAVDEHFKPETVIENALSLIGKQYLKKEIFINLRLNKRVGKVRGNPYKYEQIVFNLLSNAKDALLEKEKQINKTYRKEIDIHIYRDKNEIVLCIKDNGIGMNKEQKVNIFDPFFTTKNLGEGTGLGLSIVFGLVKEMNGRILVTSDYQSGTSVEVCIPKAQIKN